MQPPASHGVGIAGAYLGGVGLDHLTTPSSLSASTSTYDFIFRITFVVVIVITKSTLLRYISTFAFGIF